MRNFFYRFVKYISIFYMCFVFVLSYRLIYNEYYVQIHKDLEVSFENGEYVYPLGKIVGIYTESDGIFVIDTCEIETYEDDFINPTKGIVYAGDYILRANGNELKEKEDLVEIVNECGGNVIELQIMRQNSILTTQITPVKGKNGKYMLGVWVKDDLAGVGTITYYTKEGEFAALGHGMGDGVTKEIWSLDDGDIYFADLIGIQKGTKGTPGEVKGVIYYGKTYHIGDVDLNCSEGIYGTFDEEEQKEYNRECEAYQIGNKQEIQVGKAQIISDVSGERQMYDIEISYIDYLAVSSNKGLHIEVTDENLLGLTGGIVQGMSGSPILQNGKIIGAVTHVLINDPTKGYGIFIENMVNSMQY